MATCHTQTRRKKLTLSTIDAGSIPSNVKASQQHFFECEPCYQSLQSAYVARRQATNLHSQVESIWNPSEDEGNGGLGLERRKKSAAFLRDAELNWHHVKSEVSHIRPRIPTTVDISGASHWAVGDSTKTLLDQHRPHPSHRAGLDDFQAYGYMMNDNAN